MNSSRDAEHRLRLNGLEAFVMFVRENGQRIVISGWTRRHWNWNVGDRILLYLDSGESTRYRVEDVRRPGDPPDQYFMDMIFDPRST
jgi:hypothetical protein